MEAAFLFLLFVFVIIIFIVLLGIKSNAVLDNRLILKKLEDIRLEVSKLKAGKTEIDASLVTNKEIIVPDKQEISVKKEEQEVVLEKEKIQEPIPEIKKEPLLQEVTQPQNQIAEPVIKTIYQNQKTETKAVQIKKKTDFEKFIGENLLNKIGIVVLVIVLIFFGKYAVDKGWLSETAKVTAIILIGGILIGIAHRLRKNYRAFSSVLAGGGIAALYISIAVGFQLYALFNQTAAFIILIVITIFAVLLSLAYDKKELAIIAIFGGFATPLLVSTGAGNYKILFTYILILDIGMLVLAYFKKWNLVNFVANFATVLLFSIWVTDSYFNKHNLPYQGALIFVSAFYLVFFLMNIINNVKENNKFTAFEFIMLISNTFLYYWAGMFIINVYSNDYAGLYTILLAVFNFAFAFPLYRRKQIDKNLVFLLIGLVLTFISIAIPVQLKGNYITLSWAAESVILLWLSQQSGIKLLKLTSFIVSFLMFISLIMDWNQIYFQRSAEALAMPIIINQGFVTGIVAIISMLINIRLLKNDKDFYYSKNLSPAAFTTLFSVFLIISLYVTLLLEIGYQVDISYSDSGLTSVALAFFNYFYFAVVLIWAYFKNIKYILQGITIIAIVSIIIYAFGIAPEYRSVINYYLMGETSNHFGFINFAGALFAVILCFFIFQSTKKIFSNNLTIVNIMLWFSVVSGIIILSQEMDYLVLFGSGADYNESFGVISRNHLIGWPILWGALAFLSIAIGMRINEKMPRIIGISLFFFTLIKFFVMDFKDMPAGGRIIAGASIAVLLIVISFMYQKLKRIILVDEENEKDIEKETIS